jgi:hypothetical protein
VTNVSPTPTRNVPGAKVYRKQLVELIWDNGQKHALVVPAVLDW